MSGWVEKFTKTLINGDSKMATKNNAPYKKSQREARESKRSCTVIHQAKEYIPSIYSERVLDGQYFSPRTGPRGKANIKASKKYTHVKGFYLGQRNA